LKWHHPAGALAFELLALFALIVLARWGKVPRLFARLLIFAFLFSELALTAAFHVFRSHVHGFQISNLKIMELREPLLARLQQPPVLAGLAACAALSFWFAREGSIERAPRQRWMWRPALMLLPFVVVVVQQLKEPDAFATVGSSPLAEFLSTFEQPSGPIESLKGKAHPEDWAPVTELAPMWKHLAKVPRQFNILTVVLESVRHDVVWPEKRAPPMPNLQALAPHTANFTRAYSHDVRSIKSLESMTFGVYPEPRWEALAWNRGDIALDSVPERWARMGVRSAFIQNADLSFDSQDKMLRGRGDIRLMWDVHLEAFEPKNHDDRALVPALESFIDEAPGKRFGATLWVRHTHGPYQLPPPLVNKAPLSSFEAYQETVAFEDVVLGELVAMLKRRGLFESTVIVLVGDHGDSLAERPKDRSIYRAWVYESATHVPLILINPVLFHGERDDRITQLKDLAPTLTWLAGDDDPNMNVGRALFFQKRSEAAYLVNLFLGHRGGVVWDRWKYLYADAYRGVKSEDLLFDLSVDPEEKNNVWAKHPIEGQLLKDRYFGWVNEWQERWGVLRTPEYTDRKQVTKRLARELAEIGQ
jgi:arylsulfatase A-like enzyme